jgi:hypothetical protein
VLITWVNKIVEIFLKKVCPPASEDLACWKQLVEMQALLLSALLADKNARRRVVAAALASTRRVIAQVRIVLV